ncbi:MAG: hypothetical protein Q8O19_02745 [Rectinemataceae bacterium]|nr:hypothetical protein [Rectinemataceae bacterium]
MNCFCKVEVSDNTSATNASFVVQLLERLRIDGAKPAVGWHGNVSVTGEFTAPDSGMNLLSGYADLTFDFGE